MMKEEKVTGRMEREFQKAAKRYALYEVVVMNSDVSRWDEDSSVTLHNLKASTEETLIKLEASRWNFRGITAVFDFFFVFFVAWCLGMLGLFFLNALYPDHGTMVEIIPSLVLAMVISVSVFFFFLLREKYLEKKWLNNIALISRLEAYTKMLPLKNIGEYKDLYSFYYDLGCKQVFAGYSWHALIAARCRLDREEKELKDSFTILRRLKLYAILPSVASLVVRNMAFRAALEYKMKTV